MTTILMQIILILAFLSDIALIRGLAILIAILWGIYDWGKQTVKENEKRNQHIN